MSYFSEDKNVAFFAGTIVAVQLLGIWFSSFLPFQDYYDWLFQSKILFELWSNNALAIRHYHLAGWDAIPPNVFLTTFIALLQFVFSAETAGKIVLSLCILLFAAGSYKMVSVSNVKSPFRFLGLMLSYHLFFYKGFFSFSLALAVLVFVLPFFMSKKQKNPNFIPLFILAGTLLFYSLHGFVYGLFVCISIAWLWFSKSIFSNRKQIAFCLAAFIPSMAILFFYVKGEAGSIGQLYHFYDSFWHWAQTLRYGSNMMSRFVLNPTWIPLSYINLGLLLLFGGLFISQRKHIETKSFAWLLFVLFFLMMLFNPFYRIGQFQPVSSRLVVLSALLLGASFRFKTGKLHLEKFILGAALVISGLHAVHLLTFSLDNEANITRIKQNHSTSDQTLVMGKIYNSDFMDAPHRKFSGIVQPYIFLSSYLNVDSLKTFHNIQETGLVRMNTDSVTQVKTTVENSFIDVGKPEDAAKLINFYQNEITRMFSKVIIFGSAESRSLISGSLIHYSKIKQDDLYSIFKLKRLTQKGRLQKNGEISK